MLVRLEGAMNRNDLMEQMVLLPEPANHASKEDGSSPALNFVVGYNASPRSQTALDLTMWIAHQTRLATQQQVTVQVVYVVDEKQSSPCPNVFNVADVSSSSIYRLPLKSFNSCEPRNSITSVLTKPSPQEQKVSSKVSSKKSRRAKATSSQADWFEQADRILWQARCMAEEWRGSFKAHLRFGDITSELRAVVEAEAATLLFLGCHSVEHPLVEKLSSDFPCAVLGIPRNCV
ncbi:universal stress protein [Allocoleopsis sp.]|uniref:universal stress protein n=1 Tax=Allocoleopsis sp. TaxID=3088169 RepID=UPI0039C85E13